MVTLQLAIGIGTDTADTGIEQHSGGSTQDYETSGVLSDNRVCALVRQVL